jgi:hypothetical protein
MAEIDREGFVEDAAELAAETRPAWQASGYWSAMKLNFHAEPL